MAQQESADQTRTRQFFSKREFRTLEKFADVAIDGHAEPISPRDIAFNIDAQINRIQSNRKRSVKLILFLVEYILPLLSFRPPFSWMSKKMRRRFIDRKIANPRGLFSGLMQNLARVKILFLTGYYGDPDTFDSVHFKPVEERPKYAGKLTELGPADSVKPVSLYEPSSSTIDCEVCVIGSGAAGAIVAYHAAVTCKRDVVLIEEGPYVHGKDQISHDDGEMVPRLYKEGGLQTTVDLQMSILQGKCLGGATFINNAICFRLEDKELSPLLEPGVLSRWKHNGAHIDKVRLTESFERVEKMIHVGPLLDTQEAGIPPIDGKNARALIDGWDALVAAGKAPADIKRGLFKKNYKRCLGCGSCTIACRYKRKQSMVETYLPKASEAGVRIIAECHAQKIETNGKVVTGVRCKRKDGSELFIRAKKVVVSCGAVGSSVLMIKSDLHKRAKRIGTRFSFNANTPMIARFPDPVNSFDGVQMGAYIDNRDFMLESSFGSPYAFSVILPGWFGEHFQRMTDYNRYATAGVLIGTNNNARVKRTAFFRNTFGPVKYTMTEYDLERIRRGLAQLAKVYYAAGAETVFLSSFVLNLEMKASDFKDKPEAIKAFIGKHARRQADLNINSAHPQGGNPMSDDDRIGAVDSQFRVHGYDNLFVCDASVFPTTIKINPQLTIMAMADYLGNLDVL